MFSIYIHVFGFEEGKFYGNLLLRLNWVWRLECWGCVQKLMYMYMHMYIQCTCAYNNFCLLCVHILCVNDRAHCDNCISTSTFLQIAQPKSLVRKLVVNKLL